MLRLGDVAPDFSCDSTHGKINLHEYIEDSWAVLISYAADCSAICLTELASLNRMEYDFKSRNVKLLAYSCQSMESHKEWLIDVMDFADEYSGLNEDGIFV